MKAELYRLKQQLTPSPAVQLALFTSAGALTAVLVQGEWLSGKPARQAVERAGDQRLPYKVLVGVGVDDI
jgi:hypothetical protein